MTSKTWLWEETFDDLLPGTILDEGDTAWSVDISKTQTPIFEVQEQKFIARNTDRVALWRSDKIDISSVGVASFSLDIWGQGDLEATGTYADFLEVSYLLDGQEISLTRYNGISNSGNVEMVGTEGLKGETLQLFIRTKTTGGDEAYLWDNLSVTGNISTISGESSTPFFWQENFDSLANGTTVDTGTTAWGIDISQTNNPIFEVQNKAFISQNTDGLTVWQSEVIDISSVSSINFSLDIQGEGGLESSGSYTDSLSVSYLLDENKVNIVNYQGMFNSGQVETLKAEGLRGNSFQILIETKTTARDELYRWDNLTVTVADSDATTDTITDSTTDHGNSDVLSLVPHSAVTHIAVNNGSWFDPQTWQGGEVPVSDANVLIEQGVEVTYDQKSDARIKTIRIDGKLGFTQHKDTKLIVDFIAVSSTGTLEIGTEATPVQAGSQTQIIFAPVDPGKGAIDRNWDSKQLSRGLVTEHGAQVDIWGTEKTPYLTLAGDHKAGATKLVFSESVPSSWQVGDKIVVTGTQWDNTGSHQDNSITQDEVLTISSIDGNKITFSHNDVEGNALRFDHVTPDGFDLDLYVANLDRNISFSTEGGDSVPIGQRGHIMFMDHNTEIHNTGFYDLGRTNKDLYRDNPRFDDQGNLIPGTGTNPQGRYSIHLHKVFDHDANDLNSASITGNAVWGSPGWGYVVHGSRAKVEDNVSFDVLGAHYVTEDGNEQASFRRNIAIKGTGAETDPTADLLGGNRNGERDFGDSGIGFWIGTSYAATAFEDNITTGMKDAGIIIYGTNDGFTPPDVPVANLPAELQHIAGNADMIGSWKVPIHDFRKNTVYNADSGIEVRGVTRDDWGTDQFSIDHNKQSLIEDSYIWGIRETGVQISYASYTTLKDALIIGNIQNPVLRDGADISSPQGIGIYSDKNARSVIYNNVHIEGFDFGATVPQNSMQGYDTESPFGHSQLINGVFKNNNQHLVAASGRVSNRASADPLSPGTEVVPITPYFDLQGNPKFDVPLADNPPVAQFTTQSVGGYAVLFDASQSYDSDYSLTWSDLPNTPSSAGDNTIASFAWDVNSDGILDGFGRYMTYVYDSAGTYSVTLKVTDTQGNTATTNQLIDVEDSPFPNALVNGDFTSSVKSNSGTTQWYNRGWYFSGGRKWNHDSVTGLVYADNHGAGGLVQVIHDQLVTRGVQSLSFDAKNLGSSNTLRMQIYGVNGRFELSNWSTNSPDNISNTMPFESITLFDSGNLATAEFDWTTIQNSIDFGHGYEFIAVRLFTSGVTDNELQAVDNIFIGTDTVI